MAAPLQTDVDSTSDRAQQLQAEVEALRAELHRAHRLATVGTMSAMLTHEIRNILTPLVNYARLAQENPGLTDKAIQRMADGGRRANTICNALLGLTDEREQPEEVKLSELLDNTLAAMGRDPRRDGIDFRRDIPDDLTLTVRPTELEHVLLNLLLNARKALLNAPADRRLEVSAGREDHAVVLRIRDSGPGIDPGDLPHVFDAFYTTDDADDDEPTGHGLGLAVCRRIVESLDGEITADSRPGEGTTFTIRLPA